MIWAKSLRAARTIFTNPLLINAYVEKVEGRVQAVNWGDDINDHFIHLLSGREIAIYFDTPIAMALKRTNYLCIGSTLNYLTTPQSIVWGSGVIDDKLELRARPASVRAVRGPLTRDYLLRRGIDCPEVYGDPALLIPYFYKPKRTKPRQSKRIGIIPHYKDKNSAIFRAIRRANPELELIDIADYGTWTEIIDRIANCDAVFSSSLHGLVVAEAYGVPNYWVSVSDNVLGNGFKFRDFFGSLGKPIEVPTQLHNDFKPARFLATHPWTKGQIDLKKLLAACPFKIVKQVRHEHPLDL